MAFLHPSNKPYNQLVRKEEVELEISATGESSQPDALVKHLNTSILQLKLLKKNQTNKGLLDSHSFTNERP